MICLCKHIQQLTFLRLTVHSGRLPVNEKVWNEWNTTVNETKEILISHHMFISVSHLFRAHIEKNNQNVYENI